MVTLAVRGLTSLSFGETQKKKTFYAGMATYCFFIVYIENFHWPTGDA